jgi:glycerol uptake facilitator-like aquaporin
MPKVHFSSIPIPVLVEEFIGTFVFLLVIFAVGMKNTENNNFDTSHFTKAITISMTLFCMIMLSTSMKGSAEQIACFNPLAAALLYLPNGDIQGAFQAIITEIAATVSAYFLVTKYLEK